MSALKFADSHNIVAFLAKPTKSDGFEQILDFLNANPIKYVLTVNPTIYTSCIEQFWATTKVKTVNGEVQLQALVDGKKVCDKELTRMGYEKLSHKLTFYKAFFSPQWKFLIHTILQCLSAKTTAWNEFSSIMASIIMCLAINQKINFSKYIFESMVKNSDNEGKFLMYPRFIQVFLNKQVDGMATHDSGAVTPLFPTMMVQAQEEMGEGSAMPTDPHHTPIIQPSTSQPQKKQSRRKQRKDTEIPQSSGPTEPIADEAANEENVPTQSNDPPLSRVNTLGSGEDRLKLKELMDLCTKLSDRVLDLETTKTAQAKEIASLKKRVKKLERKRKSKTPGMKRLFKIGRSAQVVSSEDEGLGDQEDASKQGRKIDDIDQDAEVTLVDETQGRYDDAQMFDTDVFNGEEVFVAEQSEKVVEEIVSTAKVSVAATITTEEITLAQALAALKSAKPKVDKVVSQKLEQGTTKPTATPTTATTKGILLQEPSEIRTTTKTTTTPITSSKDKGKGIMVEEPLKMKPKDQVLFDEQEAIRLQAQFDEEERIVREKEEANAALIAQWNDIQDKVETDYELAQRLQAEEQEELTIEEKSKLFQQLLEKRRKHFAAKRAEERRNKPPTKAQQRSIMTTYLKNMAGWKPKDLKSKSFASVQELFENAMKRVNTFVDMDTELVEGSEIREEESSSKRAGDELEQEPTKKQKVDDDKEREDLQQCFELVTEEDVAIDAIPLATKPAPIVNFQIHRKGRNCFYEIMRADGSAKTYLLFSQLLNEFDREDLENLWKLVKAKHGNI
ncbi:hypothetical protein Tco_0439659 [Tanacetum coccineum]